MKMSFWRYKWYFLPLCAVISNEVNELIWQKEIELKYLVLVINDDQLNSWSLSFLHFAKPRPGSEVKYNTKNMTSMVLTHKSLASCFLLYVRNKIRSARARPLWHCLAKVLRVACILRLLKKNRQQSTTNICRWRIGTRWTYLNGITYNLRLHLNW